MCDGFSIVAGALAIGGSIYQGLSANSAAKSSAKNQKLNAQMAEQAAKDALLRGEYQAGIIRAETSRLISKQRTAFAAAGVDVSTGTPVDFQDATRALGEADVRVAKLDAAREAWGFRTQAGGMRAQASATEKAGMAALYGSILGGVGSAMSTYAKGR